jgi:hypothetical protein
MWYDTELQCPLQTQDCVPQFKIAFTPIGRPAAHGAEVTNLKLQSASQPPRLQTAHPLARLRWCAIRFGLIRGGHVAEVTASGVESRSTRSSD